MRPDTDPIVGRAEDRTVHPTPQPAVGAGRRVARPALLVLIPLLATLAAWWFTRPTAAGSGGASGGDHAHGSTGTATGDRARPVTLDAEGARRIGVTFAPVTHEPLGREVRTVGQVVVDETRLRTVTLKVDGWVERLFVDHTGQRMARGAPLLTIYSPMIVTAQEELLLARQLTQDVTEASVETRTSATELVRAARRRLRWWDVSEGEIARVEREGTAQRAITIHAPVSGVVLEKNVTAGQRIMAGEALYRVADLSSVWVDGEVYERDLGAIRAGQAVTTTFDALPGASISGRVAYVYPTLSPDTRTARVRVSLRNPDARLLPGMFATLRIQSDVRGASLSVPRGAVLATGTRHLVFVRLPNGQLEPRTVEIGAASDERVAILRGVALGDTVVASATFLVDAESNLGTALGGMGDMPGMDMTIPPRAPAPPAARPPARPTGSPPGRAPASSPPPPAAHHEDDTR